jgi:hypothetical protein
VDKPLKPKNAQDWSCALVEGPSWGDAEFYGHWLLAAVKANALLQDAKKSDGAFRKAIVTLEVVQVIDFGIIATLFTTELTAEFHSFVVDVDSEDLVSFVLMLEMGFFTRTGDRYQMTLPPNLVIDTVKEVHLKLAKTEDDDWIHPERFVVSMPYSQARKYQHLLHKMNQDQRLADRRALLFLD